MMPVWYYLAAVLFIALLAVYLHTERMYERERERQQRLWDLLHGDAGRPSDWIDEATSERDERLIQQIIDASRN